MSHPVMRTSIIEADGNSRRSPAYLAEWAARKWTDGIQIDQLKDLDSIVVQTANSVYEITVISARTGEILVQGGMFFPESRPAQFLGASFGGAIMKRFGIYIGLCIEILDGTERRITSPVHTIKIARFGF